MVDNTECREGKSGGRGRGGVAERESPVRGQVGLAKGGASSLL